MQEKIINTLYAFDIFGKSFSFEENGRSKFNTLVGSILSIIIFISTIALGILFGMELFYKESPLVLSSYEFVNSNETIIDTREFPFILNFLDRSGSPIENIENIIKLDLTHYNISNQLVASITPQEFTYCDPDDFNDDIKDFVKKAVTEFPYKNNKSSSLCLKPKNYLYIMESIYLKILRFFY